MGTKTGYSKLDDLLGGGLNEGNLYFIAGRPSMGKTSFAINIVNNLPRDEKKPVIFFSIETSEDILLNRFGSLITGVDSYNVRKGNIIESEREMIEKAKEGLKGSVVIIDEIKVWSPDLMLTKCTEIMESAGTPSLIVIDYLQLMQEGDGNVAKSLEGLKDMAKDLNVPVVVLSQLSRRPEQRKNHRPQLTDIVGTEAVKEYADAVIFLYRDEYYDLKTDRPRIAEIMVSMNKQGDTGVCELKYSPEIGGFSDIE